MKEAIAVLSATVLVMRLPIRLNLVSVRIPINIYNRVGVNPIFSSYVVDPRVTSHPQELKDAVPGKPAMFSVEATGTEPLNYQWEWKPVTGDSEWESCDGVRFAGADSSTLTIPSVQKSNEGRYRCVVSNCAGDQTSNPANLSVGKNPTIITGV